MNEGLSFDSVCIHGGHEAGADRAHLTPIFATSTYTFESAEQAADIFLGKEKGYIYGRFGNPTINEAERKIAMLEAHGIADEQGKQLELKAILHASGMAALTTLMLGNLKAGDKIISHHSLYGGTQELFDKILPPLGIQSIIVDFHDLAAVEKVLMEDSAIRLMYLETPANPTLQCIDLEACTLLGKKFSLTVCADNTFATPYLQQPFKYGVDYVLHSTTKFLNGHGTAIGGVVIGKDLEKMNGSMTKTHRLLGGNSNAFDAFLLNNGLRTLALRMDRHSENAAAVANFLANHAAVAMVNYPGLDTHPDHEIAKKQMRQYGAIMSFELKGGFEAGVKLLNKIKLCTHAVSLGVCDTLVAHPASTTHVGVPRDKRLEFGITDGLIRLSVGLEGADDIIDDLAQAIS